MPAPKGNKFAQKYGREDIINIMERCFTGLQDDTYLCIHEAYKKEGIYPQIVSEWKRVHSEDGDVLDAIKKVSDMGHQQLRLNMLRGTVNPTAAIWIDKTVYKTREEAVEEKRTITIKRTNTDE